MKSHRYRGAAALACAVAVGAIVVGTAQAGTILSGPEGWNTDNVDVGTGPVDGTFSSVVYDRAPTDPGAVTNGAITFDNVEAVSPGIKVMNGDDQGSFGTQPLNASNCIMASSDAYCDGPRQTGKRFKQQITGLGPIDLVFNVDAASTEETEYRAFQRLVNQTGGAIGGFVLTLGFGVGDDFAASTAGDGLSLTPRNSQNPTQFPFGLFGAPDAERPLGGFFDATERALFDTSFTEDSITTGMLLGSYDEYFGNGWLTKSAAPLGLLYDDDGDPTTDALVMAFYNANTGLWEQRRFIDADGIVQTLVADPSVRGPETLGAPGVDLFQDGTAWTLDGVKFAVAPIEDVANLNVNYFIQVADAGGWSTFDAASGLSTFTMRVQALGTAPAVPLPAAAPLLAAAVGGLALLRRRRRAA